MAAASGPGASDGGCSGGHFGSWHVRTGITPETGCSAGFCPLGSPCLRRYSVRGSRPPQPLRSCTPCAPGPHRDAGLDSIWPRRPTPLRPPSGAFGFEKPAAPEPLIGRKAVARSPQSSCSSQEPRPPRARPPAARVSSRSCSCSAGCCGVLEVPTALVDDHYRHGFDLGRC